MTLPVDTIELKDSGLRGPAGEKGDPAPIFIPRGDWTTGTAYQPKDLVKNGGTVYVAVVAHTAGGSFPADLGAGRWAVYQGAVPLNYPSVTPDRAWADLVVPAGIGFVDNVFGIRNNSNDGNIFGNAAISLQDKNGTERAAMGYSRNSSIQTNGYLPDLAYIEVGNPFTTDDNPSSLAFISTMKAGGPYFPGTTLKFYEYNSKTSVHTFRSFIEGRMDIVMPVRVAANGGVASPFQIDGTGGTTWRFREYDGADNFSLAVNVANFNSGPSGGITQENPALPSWRLGLNAGSDNLAIYRAAPGAPAWTPIVVFDNVGRLMAGQAVTGVGTDGQIAATGTTTRSAVTAASPSGAIPAIIAYNTASSGNNPLVLFGTEASFTARGSISYNRGSGVVAYGTTSDYRSKKDKGDLKGGLALILRLRPIKARMIGAKRDIHTFIAHEVQEVIPQAVSGEKDAVDQAGNPVMQQVDMSMLVPDLVAALKELAAKVQRLEASKPTA